MIILGSTACGDKNSMMSTPTTVNNINDIRMQNGVFDELFITTQVYTTWDGTIPQDWDFDTKIHALFQKSLFGGNVDFTSETVSSILVKKRRVGELAWKTFFEIPINSNQDFNFIRNDYYNRSGCEYQYCLIPTLNGVEGNYSSNHNMSTILSKFDGIFLVEKEVAYHAIIDISIQEERIFTSSKLEPKGRKKPLVIYNGDTNYREFNIDASFVYMKEDACTFDIENSREYREKVDNFLSNKKPKIFKAFDGRMALVCIVDSISHSENGHPLNITTSLTAAETGDCESINDLYDNNFIDCDRDVSRSI